MTGRIDIHCHLIPGIDDGCTTVDESLITIRRLIERGYTTSVLTPHIWPDFYPGNTPENIALLTENLRDRVAEDGLDYELLPGGELRLFPKAIAWMKAFGVPTLGESKAVLTDTWEDSFPRHAMKTIDWLMEEGYQPILAHPERMQVGQKLHKKLKALRDKGVLFQGNLMPYTGRDLPRSQRLAYQFMDDGLYDLLALDLHRPDTLEHRLEGLERVERYVGEEELNRLVNDAPRAILAGASPPAGSTIG